MCRLTEKSNLAVRLGWGEELASSKVSEKKLRRLASGTEATCRWQIARGCTRRLCAAASCISAWRTVFDSTDICVTSIFRVSFAVLLVRRGDSRHGEP